MDFRDRVPSEDQQLYINAKLELEALEHKIKVNDGDYQAMIDEMNATNDPEQRENIRNWLERYMSVSEYLRLKDENERWINEINEKYGLTENEETELRMEANRKRQQLVRLRSYFDRRNQSFLNDRDVSLLSNEEIIQEYNRLEYQYGREVLNDMINEDTRIKLDESRKSREDKKTSNVSVKSGSLTKEDLEKKIKKYNEDVQTVTTHLYEVKSSLVLGEIEDLMIVDVIQELDSEVKALAAECDELVSAMDEFKLNYSEESLSTNYKEVTGALRKIKDTLRNIKRTQVHQYNIKVDATNKIIEELRNLNDLNSNELLDQLPELNKYDEKISWNIPVSSYMSIVDYSKLLEVNRKILEIKNNVSAVGREDSVVTTGEFNNDLVIEKLESDIKQIEGKIEGIETEVNVVISDDDKNRLRESINLVTEYLNSFFATLENNKDKLPQEKYDELVDRYNNACEDLMDLNNKLNDTKVISVTEKNDKVYNELMYRAKSIAGSLDNLDILVHSLFGKTGVSVKEKYLELLHGHYEADLDCLEKLVEEKYNVEPKEIDNNQYDNLKNEISRLKELINNIDGKLREPGMVNDVSVNSVLNDELDSLNKEISDLRNEINVIDGKLKHDDRKKYNLKVKQLENRLDKVSIYVKEEKDAGLINKYNEVKDNFNGLIKDYSKKCPLGIINKRSAKNFYKKHKKIILISAGLAALVLVSSPVLIPAVMHGNIMLGFCNPALRGFVKFSNNILGSMIGASKEVVKAGTIWRLANGTILNPTSAATSLLKGVALSGTGHIALASPLLVPVTYSLVTGIKKLTEKMKTKDLKQRLMEEKDKLKEKMIAEKDKVVKKVKDKSSSDKNKVRRADKDALAEMTELLAQFRKSGMTLEEFADEYGLDEEEVIIIRGLDNLSKEYKELNEEKKSSVKTKSK